VAQTSGSISRWIALLPGILISATMFLIMWLTMRKRSWRDWKPWRRPRPCRRSMLPLSRGPSGIFATGEESYVDRWAIVTSKRRRRVFRCLGWQDHGSTRRPQFAVCAVTKYEDSNAVSSLLSGLAMNFAPARCPGDVMHL